MEYIIITLFGIFVGIATAGYMFVEEIYKRDRRIANQKAMIDKQYNKLQKVKAIIKSEDLYKNKVDKIKELFTDCNQDK